MRRLFVLTLVVYVSLGGVQPVQALATDGQPSFWFFFPLLFPLLALTFGSSMILNPNLNAMALIPVGDIVGSLIDQQLDGSITPFAAAVFVSGLITTALVLRMLALDEPALEPVAH